ncbi:MAG: pyruvate kinase [Thermoproteus sp.]
MQVYTKVVATLGPSTDGLADLGRLLELVDGVRINMSHATERELEARVKAVRRFEKDRGKPIAVIADLRGPSVRTGLMEPLRIAAGARIVFKLADKSDGSFVPIPRREFFDVVEKGDEILMLDGKLVLKAIAASGQLVEAEALSSGEITSNKAVVVKGKDFDIPLPVEEDLAALAVLARYKEDIDYVALSLIKNGAEISLMRKIVEEHGLAADVMAKIETKGAVDRIDEIIDAADYIVAARGDLALHYGLEYIPKVQRTLIERALAKGKPVAVATQLLDSMQTNPTPTRAEVNDVYAAASLGVDSLWLTNETASGSYPLEAVSWLRKIISVAEVRPLGRPSPANARDKFAEAVADMAADLGADIAVYSMTGTLAKRVAKFRPPVKIFAGVKEASVARKLALIWGVEPLLLPAQTYEEGLERLMARFPDRTLVATYGLKGGVHTIKINIKD